MMADWVPPRGLESALRPGIDEERRPAAVQPPWIGPGTTHTFHIRPVWHGFGGVLCMAIAAFFLGFPIWGVFIPGFYKSASAWETAGTLLVSRCRSPSNRTCMMPMCGHCVTAYLFAGLYIR
jgi:hypothetical protein